MKASSVAFLIVIMVPLLAGCTPTEVFTDQQEREFESRLARQGIRAEYDSGLTYTTGEQGIALVLEGPFSTEVGNSIASVSRQFLNEQGLQQYNFVGVFVRGSGAPLMIIDLDPIRAKTKPIWKGPGTILAPVIHKAQH